MVLRAKTRRVLKWVGTAICAGTILTAWGWTFSPRGWAPHPKYLAPRWGFAVGREYLMLYYVSIVPPPGWTVRDFTEHHFLSTAFYNQRPDDPLLDVWNSRYVGWLPTHPKTLRSSPRGFQLICSRLHLPLRLFPPLILIPVGALTGILWYVDRRRAKPGHCVECGYDLTGNVSGRCPECGTAITA